MFRFSQNIVVTAVCGSIRLPEFELGVLKLSKTLNSAFLTHSSPAY